MRTSGLLLPYDGRASGDTDHTPLVEYQRRLTIRIAFDDDCRAYDTPQTLLAVDVTIGCISVLIQHPSD
jgi:hypothetical protein